MLPLRVYDESVAQLVEHRTFNAVVPGSSPGRLTIPPPLYPLEAMTK